MSEQLKNRPLQSPQTHKVTVDFSEEAWTALDEIAQRLHVPKNEALRQSLGLTLALAQEMDQGATILIERKRPFWELWKFLEEPITLRITRV